MNEATERAVNAAIERGKAEILADRTAGRFEYRNEVSDGTITSFADLHDYVDANEYGGLCEPEQYPEFWTIEGHPDIDPSNAVQDGLDAWIKQGGLLLCSCRGYDSTDPCGHGDTSEGCPRHDPNYEPKE